MSNEKIIDSKVKSFIHSFKYYYSGDRKDYDPETPEIADKDIEEAVRKYFTFDRLTEANNYMYGVPKEFVKDDYNSIDWSLGRPAVEQTPEYRLWMHSATVSSSWHYAMRGVNLEETWVKIHGKVRTNEEAARIAADKWCELIFGWHLQDNGSINEDHPGGFNLCALGTIVAEEGKKGITDDVKRKTHDLFYEYYRRLLHHNETGDKKDIDWLVENLPDNDKERPFDWRYFGFRCELYCDYGPGTPVYLILVNGGVDERAAGSICPWKTGITIRTLDNAVQYRTYQHCDEL